MKNHPRYNKYLVGEDGTIKNRETGRVLSQRPNKQGYLSVSIFDPEENKYLYKKVHRLVCEAYIDNPENKKEVNHIDGDKTNNHVSNLEWVTSKENKEHAWKIGLYKDIGEQHHSSVLTDGQVRQICTMMEQGYRNKDICDLLGFEKHLVADIRVGRKWQHISQSYNISVQRNKRKSPAKVIEVATLLEANQSKEYINQKTGVPIYDINRIKRRAIFKDLTKDFNF